ncbi:MAG: valine--tRNA ligase [Candidatus Schekmanbacteria bacterium RIFCSPHIGHO2_02_FULL_38_11]|uniref:Valine--tRNA ligase n=1 Tax=Candidatus Schekmanbacteria bacterium RIFCSPLOWO2_12_FULL_38_15 TaxID=1817883 RepID=A0A1F7SJB4_9BACT|nr:MAG: valine--tRNA ligase [Candidatus Schekmanbacteria bacterium GWA2_38_9]OGL50912.1 MAG: valine--tRNA ligase [Candidatus Schekmanbacteria bacterium RIFCSPLOWO2_02_FULL_38_14]OGL53328.1 MAG: valine--tRNA ligase [Candidatus Schekmanbacteria bacterium RIFCSPLOWO2_12_FULL_38_15]OGL54786.1 MAG: valine--tRNA ligase [Candidatus Schekmanbacteria bacterium RIFCSPHIGHO2_02_FULL_38_11]
MEIELQKGYEPKGIEEKWYEFWLERNFSHGDKNSEKPSYSIVIPPPNVTGSLHIGHALNNTLQDILARFKRMDGYNVAWIPGTDHAGIATQNVVEKELMKEGIKRDDIGREEFIKRVWRWKEKKGGLIIKQLKRMGCSCDWQRERFTMDKGLSDAVKEVFIRLYQEGLIYRGNYIINWCPRCRTALSDLEVEHLETKGKLYHINYPVLGEKGKFLTVATTRPETMLGDTAVAINPEDERYREFRGKKVILPLMNREIPIIEDNYVSMDFGTGALKVTPAHDANDFEIGLRHNLLQVNVLAENGLLNELAGKYNGLERFKAREVILKDLEGQELLVKTEDYLHGVGHCYRCRTVVEPYLSKQWFVKTKDLAKPAIEAVRSGKIKIIPKGWENTYFEWMENIRDWCISRQIWWGHRIPAWYCKKCGEVLVEKDAPLKCRKCESDELVQESDVLDTWFSSGLWPFSTMGWPERTKELETFYPTSCLVTSFDILFFWVARMIMLGLKFMKDVPFRDVYIHALIRDVEGQKMSKSRGNVVDPLDIIGKFGADTLRFTLAALASQGRDIRLSEERLEGYRNFANKLWNASRFVISNTGDFSRKPQDEKDFILSDIDKWIYSKLHEVIKEVRDAFDNYRFNEAANSIYQFLWHEYCDWYIEFTKPDLIQETNEIRKRTAQKVLTDVLERILRLLHPFMPFITEEIWQYVKPEKSIESIMISSYPKQDDVDFYPEETARVEELKSLIKVIRNIRSEMDIPPSTRIKVYIKTPDSSDSERIDSAREYISKLCRTSEINVGINLSKPKASATGIVRNMELFVPLEGILDFEEEKKRLEKKINKLEKDFSVLERKLKNEDFIKNAPAEVVEKDKEKHNELIKEKIKIEGHLKALEELQ